MNEPTQIELFDPHSGCTKRRVEYVAPEPKIIDHFVSEVCQRLVAQGNTAYGDPEIASGLATFLNHIAQVKVKQLNQ